MTNLKYYAWISFVACIIAGIAAFIKGCHAQKEVKTIERAAIVGYDSVKHYRDLYDTDHAQREQVIADKQAADILFRQEMDSVCKRLDINRKQLQTMEKMLAEAKGSFTTPVQTVTVHDTIPGMPVGWSGKKFEWVDDYMTMAGYVDSQKATIFYDMTLPININTYWKRRWFLGRKRYYVDGYSSNPSVHITGLSGVKIN